ncbi:MAG: hypothetical protein QW702_08760 [Candidatus Bathyarchaeia archaeon]
MRISKLFVFIVMLIIILFSLSQNHQFENDVARNYDPQIFGINWYVTGWHLETASSYIKEILDEYDGMRGVFHGLINDTRGDTIYSVSICQGYFPQGWRVQYWLGSHQGRNRLMSEGKPNKLKVRFMIKNYGFNLNPQDTYCGFCWVTIAVDLRGSIIGKSYNASWEFDGQSWVTGIVLFQVELNNHGLKFIKKGDVVLATYELYHGYDVERLYHYSVGFLDSDEIRLGVWYEVDLDLKPMMESMERRFNIKVDRTHLIQPFIETCGGWIEAYYDYVELHA